VDSGLIGFACQRCLQRGKWVNNNVVGTLGEGFLEEEKSMVFYAGVSSTGNWVNNKVDGHTWTCRLHICGAVRSI